MFNSHVKLPRGLKRVVLSSQSLFFPFLAGNTNIIGYEKHACWSITNRSSLSRTLYAARSFLVQNQHWDFRGSRCIWCIYQSLLGFQVLSFFCLAFFVRKSLLCESFPSCRLTWIARWWLPVVREAPWSERGFQNWGYPKWMVDSGKYHLQLDDDLEVPPFMVTPKFEQLLGRYGSSDDGWLLV